MPNVLIVDDEADIRTLLAEILEEEGYRVRLASNASVALKEAEVSCPDAVILDIWLEGSKFDGIGVLKKLKLMYPLLPVIMISGHGNIETAVKTIRCGAYDFIEKPFKAEKLIIMLDRAISTYLLIKENIELKQLNEINSTYIGNSKSTISLLNNALKVAPTNSRIIIIGEQGTGKEVLARYIHNNSLRKNQPFFVLYAKVIVEKDFEEELLGINVKNNVKEGILDKINGGTLFIDEVSELPLNIQNVFLKILQDTNITKKYDIRIIASSSKNLLEEIKNSKLSQSFYYRINIISLNIIPLNERRDDIVTLIDYFIKKFSQVLGINNISLTLKALEILQFFDWPGNVRQLKNIIEGLLIINGKNKALIDTEDLPIEVNPNAKKINKNSINIDSNLILQNLKEARDNFEREYLSQQLKRFSHNISKVAKFIGMERTALHRKMKTLGLNVE